MQILIQLLQLLPAIIAAVKAVEAALPIPGQGRAKLDLVLGVIEDTGANVAGLIGPVTKMIARIVSLFNSTGTFQTGGQPAPPH